MPVDLLAFLGAAIWYDKFANLHTSHYAQPN